MSNSTIIGTTSNFYGVATFQSQPVITSTILANNDNSTNIATTAWANSFLTYAQTQPNSWTGAQTFTTANVSVLNVSTAIVNTINASSITSDMTIGANLNGGSITIGAAGATTSIRGTTNINTTGSATTSIGNINTTTNISGSTVNVANEGLSATGKVNIASGTNETGSEMYLGSTTLSKCYIRGGVVNISGSQVKINDQGGTLTMGSSGTSYISLGALNTTFNIGGSTSPFNMYSPIILKYNTNSDLNTLGGLMTQSYVVGTATAGYATSKVYCCAPAIPAGNYLTMASLRTYGLSVASPFLNATIILSSIQQVDNTTQTGLTIGGQGGQYYQNIYVPNTSAGYAIQIMGTITADATYKYPAFTLSTDSNTQSVAWSLNLIRIG